MPKTKRTNDDVSREHFANHVREMRKHDRNFMPGYINPEDLDTLSPKTSTIKKHSRGSTQLDDWYRDLTATPGRPSGSPPVTETIEFLPDYNNITVWFDGKAILRDYSEELPLNAQQPWDPTKNVLDVISHYLNIVDPPHFTTIEITDHIDPILSPIPDDLVTHRWTNIRVTKRHVHEYLHNKNQSQTFREIADALYGPFTNTIYRANAEKKIRTHVRDLVKNGFVEKDLSDNRLHLWHSVQAPLPVNLCDPTRLGITPKPEPKTGTLSFRILGSCIIMEYWDNRHEALDRLKQILEPYDINVRIAINDPTDPESPAPRPYKFRRAHFDRRVTLEMALDVLAGIRKGQYGPTPWKPTLCYFGFWARMLYRPPSSDLDTATDKVARDAPDPTTEEQRAMERKAYQILLRLERDGVEWERLDNNGYAHIHIVRRRAPGGRRTILFRSDDPEANDYPKLNSRPTH